MEPKPRNSRQLFYHLVSLYVQGSTAAVVVVLFLVYLGLEFTSRQWWTLLGMVPVLVLFYVVPDIYLIARQYRPIRQVLGELEGGGTPSSAAISDAIVQALNLPYYSFLRVVVFHGPAASLAATMAVVLGDVFFHTGILHWQVFIFGSIVLFFASPTHAIFEFFSVSRCMVQVVERLYPLIDTLDKEHQARLRSVGLRKKLLYLALFVTSLPLLFLAGSVMFKVGLMFADGRPSTQQISGLLIWVCGVVAICMVGALIMSMLTAAEVSSSAQKLRKAMKSVEEGKLDVRLQITSTDEYADLFRGFNLMTEGLHEEVKILGISQSLMGELNLDLLVERIMRATTDLLDADRSSLFIHDPKTNELWSRFAEGLDSREIRMPASQGIAGAVFTTGKVENIVDAANDARFNPEVDKRTGYRTTSILCIPVVNKAGRCIGVTEVLNKRGGPFTSKDESRLRAFTAQIAIALENAKLFDDVLRVQNYNESILRSTSNSMITLDAEHRVVTANAATLRLLKTETLVGARVEELFHGSNDWVLRSLANVEATGERDLAVDAQLTLESGEVASVNLTSVPLIDANQNKIGSMLIIEDISSEKRVKSTMSRYMSKEVVDQLLVGGDTALGGQIQRVSVLFSDIRDFTTVTESIGARETVSMLNQYFEEMVDVIFRHDGILDKYIGDAIMALFGAPFAKPLDANNAARTAVNMIVQLRLLNERRVAAGLRPIDIGIGVNTGDVVLGSIGSPKRMEYTAIGDSVNLASRLEGACKIYGAKVLLSQYTVGELTDSFRLREIDLMRVKGKKQPVAIFEALDHHSEATFPNMEEAIAHYSKGLLAYRAADWAEAGRCFEAALAANPNDKPSQIFRERVEHFIQEPPAPGWDGVWVHKEK